MQQRFVFGVVAAAFLTVGAFLLAGAQLGYEDTPFLPGQKWRVHDKNRPQPPVVAPGRNWGDLPSDAMVLFDGTDLSRWCGSDSGPARWKVENGYMEVVPGTGDIFNGCG